MCCTHTDNKSNTHTDLCTHVCNVPAPCLRSSAAEFVDVCADESFSSSIGSASENTEMQKFTDRDLQSNYIYVNCMQMLHLYQIHTYTHTRARVHVRLGFTENLQNENNLFKFAVLMLKERF